GRIDVAGRAEERMALGDALVEDPDLDAVSRGREGRQAPELVGADQLRAPIEARMEREARIDRRDAGNPRQRRQVAPGHDDGQAGAGAKSVQTSRKSRPRLREPMLRAATMPRRADVAELVDAHGSGPCGGDPVEVQVLSSASRP